MFFLIKRNVKIISIMFNIVKLHSDMLNIYYILTNAFQICSFLCFPVATILSDLSQSLLRQKQLTVYSIPFLSLSTLLIYLWFCQRTMNPTKIFYFPPPTVVKLLSNTPRKHTENTYNLWVFLIFHSSRLLPFLINLSTM